MNDILQSAITVYLVLYVIKFCLILQSLPYAASAVSIRETGKRWSWFWFVVLLIALPIALLVMLLPLLVNERARFFILYRNRAILRDIISATK